MQKRNHIWMGAVFVFLLILLMGWLGLNWISFGFASVLTIAAITVFYSLLPDIDHKNSTITWWFFGAGVFGLLAGISGLYFHFSILSISSLKLMLFSTILLAFTYIATNLFEHRGKIHTVQAGLLSVIPLFLLFGNFAYCLIAYAAWHSHLVADGYFFKVR